MCCGSSFRTCFLDPDLPAVHPVRSRAECEPSGLLRDEVGDHLAGVQYSRAEVSSEALPSPVL
eukprot:5012067-Heterocapsa_arctica.AAC.1